ncbi:MAG: hypothetical protein ACBR12_23795, partial [Microcoleus sp.]
IQLVTRLCLVTQIQRLCLHFCCFKSEAEPLDIGSLAEPGNQLRASGYSTRYQALPGNADPEALPPFLLF